MWLLFLGGGDFCVFNGGVLVFHGLLADLVSFSRFLLFLSEFRLHGYIVYC